MIVLIQELSEMLNLGLARQDRSYLLPQMLPAAIRLQFTQILALTLITMECLTSGRLVLG
ncbi:MAG: hypothetical protein AUI03_09125 [Nitrospirae bacterium 13_2_20CM_2_62_8]|nr:MAG: hypothetical protein AUI03_09125 [Nitrospirae bacterium 13_2_20CM_2_62_8]